MEDRNVHGFDPISVYAGEKGRGRSHLTNSEDYVGDHGAFL